MDADLETPTDQSSEGETQRPNQASHTLDKQPVKPRAQSLWAWVVVSGGFVAYVASMGYSMSLSVYLTTWMGYFDTNAVTTGLVVSISILMRGLLSPMAGALCTKFGARAVTMVGGAVIVGGIVMSSLASSVEFLIFSNGCVAALGVSMVYVASVQVLGMYFSKKYAVAVGLASAGISVGQLAMPPLSTYLIDIYGWKGSLLVTAGINLHILAAGALMRPVVRHSKTETRGEKNEPKCLQDRDRTNGNAPQTDNEAIKESINGSTSQVDNRSNTGANAVMNDIGRPEGDSEGNASGELGDKEYVTIVVSDLQELVTGEDSGPVDSTAINPFTAAVAEDGLNQLSLCDSDVQNSSGSVSGYLPYFSRLKYLILDTYGLRRLVHNMYFLLTLFMAFCHGFGKLGVTYIVARAESVGIDLSSSALLLSLFGVGNMLGRISNGWFIHKKYITSEMTYALAMLGFCLSVSLMPAFVVFAPLAVLAVLQGISAGTAASVIMVIVRAQVQPCDAAVALGFLLMFINVGNVAGVFVSGVSYDTTKSYDVAFFVGGAIMFIASVLSCALHFLQKAKHVRQKLPASKLYVKFSRNSNEENNQIQPVDSTVDQPDPKSGESNDDDLGNVEVLTGNVVVKDSNAVKTKDEKKRKSHLRRRYGQKREDGEGIENPMVFLQDSINITASDEIQHVVNNTENDLENCDVKKNIPVEESSFVPSSSGTEDTVSAILLTIGTTVGISEGDAKSIKADAVHPECTNLSPTSDFKSVSSSGQGATDREWENSALPAEHAVGSETVSRDYKREITSNMAEFDVGSGNENPGFVTNTSDE